MAPATTSKPAPAPPPSAPDNTSKSGGLLKRFASKLQRPPQPPTTQRAATIPAPPTATSAGASTSRPRAPTQTSSGSSNGDMQKRKSNMFGLPPMPKPHQPTHPNDFTSAAHREAVLRAYGLVPARYRDAQGFTIPLSEQEKQMDERFTVVKNEPARGPRVSGSDSEGESEAKRIREAWLRRNEENEVGEGGSGDESEDGGEEDGLERREGPISGMPVPRFDKDLPPPALLLSATVETDGAFMDHVGDFFTDSARDQLTASPPSSLSAKSLGSDAHGDDRARVAEWLRSTPAGSPPTSPTKTSSVRLGHDTDVLPPPSPSFSSARRKGTPTPISTPVNLHSPTTPVAELPGLTPSPPSSPPIYFEDPRSPRAAPIPTSVSPSSALPTSLAIPYERGRTAIPVASSVSQSSSVPTLSPTRSLSSLTSDSPRTPLTESASQVLGVGHSRRSSVASRQSMSSEGGSATPRNSASKEKAEGGLMLRAGVAAVIMESVGEEEGMPVPMVCEPLSEMGERKRTGLFGRHVQYNTSPKAPRTTTSATNLRSVAGTLTGKFGMRPRTTYVADNDKLSASNARPIVAHNSTTPIQRLRQPLSPTMHDRGSILVQTKGIEDEESRRLSELAFLDF